LQAGDKLTIIKDAIDEGWFECRHSNGMEGLAPASHVFPDPPSQPRPATAKFMYKPESPDELPLQPGDKITILRDAEDEGWYEARSAAGREGLVPATHVVIDDSSAYGGQSTLPAQKDVSRGMPAPTASAAQGRPATAKFAYQAAGDDELSFAKGDKITILRDAEDEGWYEGRNDRGQEGLVPATHIVEDSAGGGGGGGGGGSDDRPCPAGMKPGVAKFDFEATNEDELTFKKGDKLYIMDAPEDPGWYMAIHASKAKDGKTALAPSTHIGV